MVVCVALLGVRVSCMALPKIASYGRPQKTAGFRVNDMAEASGNQAIVDLWLDTGNLRVATVDGVKRLQKCCALVGCEVRGEMAPEDLRSFERACSYRSVVPFDALSKCRDSSSTGALAAVMESGLAGAYAIDDETVAVAANYLDRFARCALNRNEMCPGDDDLFCCRYASRRPLTSGGYQLAAAVEAPHAVVGRPAAEAPILPEDLHVLHLAACA